MILKKNLNYDEPLTLDKAFQHLAYTLFKYEDDFKASYNNTDSSKFIYDGLFNYLMDKISQKCIILMDLTSIHISYEN